jgi:peptide-methionine (S)-S-oxide reductase
MPVRSARVQSIAWLAFLSAITTGCNPRSPTDSQDEWTVWALSIPPANLDTPPPAESGAQTVVVAGGCFWGVEAVFKHVQGVLAVVPGYAGGTAATAHYEDVTSGRTDHAESVQIRFDPATISFGKILQVFFSVAHDPTQIDAQFPDVGPQYRSHIYYTDPAQNEVARAYIAQLDGSGVLPRKIATRVDPLTSFFPAEAEHQDYAAQNPDDPYIVAFDLPKLDGLKSLFPDLYRER